MIVLLYINILFLFSNIYAQRRIVGGNVLSKTEKRYMVYLTLSEDSLRAYDTWICGGAIIHPQHVLTSAACIQDVERAYVVAGYDKYVKLGDLNKDNCTAKMKRRIISTHMPIEYDISFLNLTWVKLDIAVVKVEKDLTDPDFTKYCSYLPMVIKVNFDVSQEQPGRSVKAFGWGHETRMRMKDETVDLNANKLRFVSTIIYSKKECKKFYTEPDLSEYIDKYMICTKNVIRSESNDEIFRESTLAVPSRLENYKKQNSKISTDDFYGICQNDHGGPLIASIKKVEKVVGVASMFRINEKGECHSPDLFTSTALNRLLIECSINPKQTRSSECFNIRSSNTTYKIFRRQISWEGHAVSDDDKESTVKKFHSSTTKDKDFT